MKVRILLVLISLLPLQPVHAQIQRVGAKARAQEDLVLNKTPKAIFLIKRTKVDSDIGEPILYPFERQLRNLYYSVGPGGSKK